MKKVIYQTLVNSALCKDIAIEYPIGDRIADIFLKNSQGKEVAIECPSSSLDILEFRKKIAYYSYKGIYGLWIFSGNTELDKRLVKLVHARGARLYYKSTELERRCHKWYYGRFYYFYNNTVYAVHLHPIEKWVASSCDECIDESRCEYPERADCPKYSEGHFQKPKELREISIYPVTNFRLMCVDRKDKLRIAKFNEPTWWKV